MKFYCKLDAFFAILSVISAVQGAGLVKCLSQF